MEIRLNPWRPTPFTHLYVQNTMANNSRKGASKNRWTSTLHFLTMRRPVSKKAYMGRQAVSYGGGKLGPYQYEIWSADLDGAKGDEMQKTGRRPVVVVSPNSMQQNLSTVVVCPLTSRLHWNWSGRLPIHCEGLANKDSEVAVDQIRTLDKGRFDFERKCIDRLSRDDAKRLRSIVRDLYGPTDAWNTMDFSFQEKRGPRQYEVWVADLDGAKGDEMQGTCPVAVVRPNFMKQNLSTAVVCPLTSTLHGDGPRRLWIVCAGRDSQVAVDQIRTLSKERFVRCIDGLSRLDARRLCSTLRDLYAPQEE